MNLYTIVIKVQIPKVDNWQISWGPNRPTGNYFKSKYWHVNCPRCTKTRMWFKNNTKNWVR